MLGQGREGWREDEAGHAVDRKRPVTILDVARMAGVSTATVSRAVNEPGKVSDETRERVQQAIDRLGYTPNFGGRLLAAGRSSTIGAVIPTMANAMFAGGLQAFQEILAQAGKTLLVASTGYSLDNELTQIRTLVARGAEGLMLIGRNRGEATRAFLARRRVAHVMTWCHSEAPGELCVGFDNHAAALDLTNRVLALGHRSIAMISGKTPFNDRARARQQGVRAAAQTAGARLSAVIECDYDLGLGASALREIMAGPRPPTAIVCGNDILAAGAILGARQMGISVPGQVSIVGFDDHDLARMSYPALTTVRIPQVEMGHQAARLLLDLVAGREDCRSILLPTEFIDRDSLAPPHP